MRKYLSFAQAVLLTTGLWATSSQAMNKAFTGFQAKGSLGYAAGSAKFKGTHASTNNVRDRNVSFDSSNLNAQVSLGYFQEVAGSVVLGGGAYAFYNPLNSKGFLTTTATGAGIQVAAKLKRVFGYGANLTGGYTVSDSALVYAGLAVERSKFSIKQESNGFDVAKKSKNLWGFGPIVGAKMALTDSMALNLEGTYILYKKWTQRFQGETSTLTLSSSPKVLSFNVGVSYAF